MVSSNMALHPSFRQTIIFRLTLLLKLAAVIPPWGARNFTEIIMGHQTTAGRWGYYIGSFAPSKTYYGAWAGTHLPLRAIIEAGVHSLLCDYYSLFYNIFSMHLSIIMGMIQYGISTYGEFFRPQSSRSQIFPEACSICSLNFVWDGPTTKDLYGVHKFLPAHHQQGFWLPTDSLLWLIFPVTSTSPYTHKIFF